MGEKADESRTLPREAGGATERPEAPLDLLVVALAAYAAHLENHARARVPGPASPWGRSARIAGLRRFTR